MLRERVAEALADVQLEDRADDRIGAFSGGMRRRANIAVALLHQPELLILDEPTVGVDPQSRSAILDHITRLAQGGRAILFTSHYLDEAQAICHRVGIVDHGRMIAEDTPAHLCARIDARGVVRVRGAQVGEQWTSALASLPAVVATNRVSDAELEVHLNHGSPARAVAELLRVVEENGAEVVTIEVGRPDLEEVFLTMTGRELRDG